MKNLYVLLLALFPLFAAAQERLLYVGTYTARGSEGIYVYKFNEKTGTLTSAGACGGIKNPSFLAVSPDKNFLYAVAENDTGAVYSYRIDATSGKLNPINQQPVNGIWPCHLAIDHTGARCIVGNYGSGNVCVLPISEGALGAPMQTIQHKGKSANKERQEKPHVHSINIAPNNRDVFVADLGTDKIMAYTLDSTFYYQLKPSKPAFVEVKPGAGPRHFAFHPNGKFAYAILELDCTVAAFKYGNGTLEQFQTINTLPASFKGKNTCADIHISPDGKFLYGSNRGHNSIVIYKINPETGELKLVGFQSVIGSMPRNFTIDPTGKFLLVANQESDNIQVFRRNRKNGRLAHLGEGAKLSMPVCLLFL